MRDHQRFFIYACVCYLFIGFGHVGIGSVMPQMLSSYQEQYGDGGWLVSMQFLGFLVGVLIAPYWAHIQSKTSILMISIAAMSLTSIVYALHLGWSYTLLAAPFGGFGLGVIETMIGALVIQLFASRKAVKMSQIEVFFGVGALILPLCAGLLIRIDLWYAVFLITASLGMLLWLVTRPVMHRIGQAARTEDSALVRTEESAAATEDRPFVGTWTVLRSSYRLLIWFCLYFMLYVGLEISLVSFMPSMVLEKSAASESIAAFSVTFFWITMSIGRMIAGYLSEATSYLGYLLASAAGTGVGLLGMAMSNHYTWLLVSILWIGLCMSGMFAIGLVAANEAVQGYPDQVISLMIASGGIGGSILPLLLGNSLERAGTGNSLMLLGLTTLFMLAMLWIPSQWLRKNRRKGQAVKTG
ncbi:MFS transporter [Marinicrinis sediminis]|uniref:MFS transporter n=1 Tax=Marinicrinis sediminis TaxID=1652465 RepID=A0ABW5RGF3_9BACL